MNPALLETLLLRRLAIARRDKKTETTVGKWRITTSPGSRSKTKHGCSDRKTAPMDSRADETDDSPHELNAGVSNKQ